MNDVIRHGRQEPMLPEPTFRYEDEQQPDGTILRRAVLVGELPVADGYEDEDTLYARIEQAEAERDEALADADARVTAWAELAMRFMEVAPTEAVMDETGIVSPHSTPPERKAIREKARATVAAWLERDRAFLRRHDAQPGGE